jgi:hypothetical protein
MTKQLELKSTAIRIYSAQTKESDITTLPWVLNFLILALEFTSACSN